MPIYIHNSLTRKKEEFIPLTPPKVNIYTCGVTVYDDCHIGHARSLYIFDLISRYLVYRGFKVNFVRNITDIDDKIIARANELKIGWQELVKKYIDRYYEDLAVLGIEKAHLEPRATENIADMIKYIQGLLQKGYAYQAGGDVYFSVRKFSGYGKLSNQSIEQMESGVRIEPSDLKKDHLDFALWKASKENEPFWESPWGKGRPGWHIECSVMSQKFLKTDTLDIHAGGLDLIFPHHENEIAQAESFTGRPFAKYWMHHGLLTIDGKKMSKSLGNFVTIKNFIEKYRDVDFLKLFFLSAHYAHPIDYTEEKIEEAKKNLERFNYFFDIVNTSYSPQGGIKPALSDKDKTKIDNICLRFEESMDDDFNTSKSLACLFELMDFSSARESTFDYAKSKLEGFFRIFGLRTAPQRNIPEKTKKLLLERDIYRKNKNFIEADRKRKEIEKDNLFVVDTGSNISITVISLKGHNDKKDNR